VKKEKPKFKPEQKIAKSTVKGGKRMFRRKSF